MNRNVDGKILQLNLRSGRSQRPLVRQKNRTIRLSAGQIHSFTKADYRTSLAIRPASRQGEKNSGKEKLFKSHATASVSHVTNSRKSQTTEARGSHCRINPQKRFAVLRDSFPAKSPPPTHPIQSSRFACELIARWDVQSLQSFFSLVDFFLRSIPTRAKSLEW